MGRTVWILSVSAAALAALAAVLPFATAPARPWGPDLGLRAPDPGPPDASAPTNHGTAVLLAAGLLASAPLPPGAIRLAGPPAGTSGALGQPGVIAGTPNLVDDHEVLSVPMAPAATRAWLQAHPEPGTTVAENGTAADRGGATSWTVGDLEGRVPPGIAQAGLSQAVDAEPVGTGSAVRIDAEVTWLPDRPSGARVPAGTGAVTVTVGSAPRGTAAAPGTVPGPVLLGPVTATARGTVHGLAGLLNGLPTALPGTYNCPVDVGIDVWLQFRTAPDGPVRATAAVDTGGCQGVTLWVGDSAGVNFCGGHSVVTVEERDLGVTVPGRSVTVHLLARATFHGAVSGLRVVCRRTTDEPDLRLSSSPPGSMGSGSSGSTGAACRSGEARPRRPPRPTLSG